MEAIVTGGCGFIGSNLVKRLISLGWKVKILDNLSTGSLSLLNDIIDETAYTFSNIDLKNEAITTHNIKNVDVVFHLAADPDVRTGISNPRHSFENNVLITFNVLEAMRKNDIKYLVFTSSSTVYGDAKKMPTPEDYPCLPISVYGGAKLACEALIRCYASAFGIKGLIIRPANIIGKGGTHGVIIDFINKLKKNSRELEILGDGKQRKSYLHISDSVKGILCASEHFFNNNSAVQIYNLGNPDWLLVSEIAEIVIEQLDLQGVKLNYTGGVGGGRGWKGDVKKMLLSIEKLQQLGWTPSLNSKESVTKAVQELLG